jgi:transketolase
MNQKNFDSRMLAFNLSKRVLQLAYKNRASHIGGALSVKDILSVLYAQVLNYNTANPKEATRDRLFYSKGHACLSLYTILSEVGFYSLVDLETFTSNGSYFTSHVNSKIPGIELSTGSLGHALSVACGVALAGKRNNHTYKVYAILSDGELDEGSNWEAILFAAHHKLDNLTIIVDYNKIQSFGTVHEVLNLEPLADKFKSFGCKAIEVDGHNHESLSSVLNKDNITANIPTVIIAHTVKGKGVAFMENELAWHYKSPDDAQLAEGLKLLELNNK